MKASPSIIFRTAYEYFVVLLVASATAFYFIALTAFITYSEGIPGGIDATFVFLPTPILFLGSYLWLTKFKRLATWTGPWKLIITMSIGINLQYLLVGVTCAYYCGLERYFAEIYRGLLIEFLAVLMWALVAAGIGIVFWLIERGLWFVLIRFVFPRKLP